LWHELCYLFGFSPKENKDVTGAGHEKENAINTIRSGIHRKGKYCFDCDFFPVKNSGSWTRDTPTNYRMSMTENLESVRNRDIRTFIRTKETAMDLPKMQRNSVCSPWFLFYLWGVKRIILSFLKKKYTFDCGFSSFSRLGSRPPIREAIMLRYPRGMVSAKGESRFPCFKIQG